MRTRWSTPTSMLDNASALKPSISTSTVYVPVGIDGAVYSPAASLFNVRVSPVFWLVMVSLAPVTTAPVLSVIVPRSVPVTA
ncbi:MAG: hypothetical protein JJE40_06505 [Vicinamibacteria bacterium]|nr:hypothetical protein [Vicinamibacteria bacterium]